MRELFLRQFKDFVGALRAQSLPLLARSTAESKAIYETYDDRDIRDYESGQQLMLVNNALKMVTCKAQHAAYMALLFEQIDPVVAEKGHVTVLEVGAGNCLNIASIIERYGSKVSVSGIDIAENRIRVAQSRIGDRLTGARLSAQSITSPTTFDDDEFDVVYSMFCLEQIAYETRAALLEMDRVCRGKIVMLEPVFENGTPLQRLYLIVSDHVRILLKTIRELGLPLVRNDVLDLQFNPANQASILIVDHAAAAAGGNAGP